MRSYDHTKIEKKWQKEWSRQKLHETPDTKEGAENSYLLVEFPYPSGNLHVGHWYAFAVPDILARKLRMDGKNVLYPIGFDAFGLPAENAAIKNKLNPRTWTEGNIKHMKEQIRSMGTSFDWSREVITADPTYYRWTQWMFLQFFNKGLAYQKETAVNWCPNDKTVLANEQVVNGKCERCGAEVEQRNMLQWNLKITDYADRLINDLEPLDWPKEIKESQKNWIGRSEGAEIDFPLDVEKKYKFVILHGLHGFESEGNKKRLEWMKEELEKLGHQVLTPALPNPNDPSEEEQVSVALSATEYDENTVLCGFSLGSMVALKVIERLKKPIARLVTAGGFIDTKFKDGKERGYESKWNWKFDAAKIKKNVSSITVLHDPNDHAISDDQAGRLAELLGVPVTSGRSVKSHFRGDTEPDVLMWLRPTIRVFTTRPDTLFGATYLVLAPEHPWVQLAIDDKHDVLSNKAEVKKYDTKARKKTERERLTDQKEKTGVKLEGVSAINPATGEKIPLFVADYVLGHYGTGAIMAVPAHDERDYEFARKFDLPIKNVIAPYFVDDNPPTDTQFEKRNTIHGVVVDPKNGKILLLDWKNYGWKTFVLGGREEGETVEEAARREIKEETGLNVVFKKQLGGEIVSKFYAQHKKVWRHRTSIPVLFELADSGHVDVAPEEAAQHVPVWLTPEEAAKAFRFSEDSVVLNRYMTGNGYWTGEGVLVNSNGYDEMTTAEARKQITEKFGRKKTTYKIRDWVVSRQRYWGVPIPIIHCEKCGAVAVPDKELPIELPEIKDYLPTGDGASPLAKAKKWVETTCPQCGGKARRETDTLDTFVDSSWYFLRYTDPNNKKEFASRKKMDNWMPVELYSGGAEHTTMHLLYSRFWQKAMFDLGLVKDAEPYKRRMNRSLILGPDGQKMSKSKGNVIDPDKVVENLGADTVRMYLAFIGPYNEVSSYPWNPDGVVGIRRFLERVWRLHEKIVDDEKRDASVERTAHQMAKKVTEDIPLLKFNTAIAAMMGFVNEAEAKGITKGQYKALMKILAPFAPHMTEEIWSILGNETSIHLEKWPKYDPAKLVSDTVTIAVQVNGKSRSQIIVASSASEEDVRNAAEKAASKWLEGREVARVIFVPDRLINLVLA